MVTSLLPEHNWQAWKFRTLAGYWNSKQNQLSFLEHLEKVNWQSVSSYSKTYNIHSEDQWYKITNKDIINEGGKQFLSIFHNSLFNALSSLKPQIHWKPHQFSRVPQ